jgi:type I restriction enzyme S subunit
VSTNSWTVTPIKALYARLERRGRSDLPLLSVYRNLGVVQREGHEDNYNRPGEDLDAYKYVQPGNLVLNKMKTWQGSLGVSEHEGIVSPAYFVCKQIAEADSRFLHHMLRSQPLIDEYARRSKGIRPAQWDLPWEEFRDIHVFLPPLPVQRAIAHYLDTEIARIDALIEKKRRMVELMEVRFWTAFTDSVLRSEAPLTQLRRAIAFITDGPFGSAFSSSDYSEDGAAVVRLGNIGFAEYRPEAQAFVPLALYHSFLRHRVRAGDLLIAGLGDSANHAGRACVAPDLGPAMVKGKCFCARMQRDLAMPEYLALLLSSPFGAESIGVSGRGSTRTMINLDVVKSAVVPLPAVECQQEMVSKAHRERKRLRLLTSALAAQIELLSEHRQALITAAVTGELDTPGVAA